MKEATDVTLKNHLDELAAFEPTRFPFVSLYLNMQADQQLQMILGIDNPQLLNTLGTLLDRTLVARRRRRD